MLINDTGFSEELQRIVNGFTRNTALRDDLLQEALIHAWKVETEKPDRTRSWYLQSCRFHLQHWLALGRSVDSLKRATADTCLLIDEDELHEYNTNGECFESVSFCDLVQTLSRHLRPLEDRVLQGLARGMLLREIARKSGISYPTALKYRRKIARLVSQLELQPISTLRRQATRPSLVSQCAVLHRSHEASPQPPPSRATTCGKGRTKSGGRNRLMSGTTSGHHRKLIEFPASRASDCRRADPSLPALADAAAASHWQTAVGI